SLVMTPQLQLAIKLLQLSRLELVEMVRDEILVNPVIEDIAGDGAPAEPAKAEGMEEMRPEVDWQAYLESQDDFSKPRLNFNERGTEDDDFIGRVSAAGEGLTEHLLWQLRLQCVLTEDEVRTGEFIIGNIDESGYLRVTERAELTDDEMERAAVSEISSSTGALPEEVERILRVIQQFDPAGVGARTLRECLLLQARFLPVRDTAVEEIISKHLELLGRKNYKAIARTLGITLQEVFEAAKVIEKRLNPAPGAGYGKDDARAIVPDIYIHKVGPDYVVSLNEDGMPKLKISRYYRDILKGGGGKEYIQDKMRSALWLIKSVHQRQRTIYRVVECIVRFQRDFLDMGLKYLSPMVLKDVADEIGVHESTVSRVTSNKYVQTPRGIFELKYFFSNGLGATGGNDVTAEYVKEKVRAIIEAEDPKKPMSDKQIVDKLKETGIKVARRTATKYREGLGFLSSSRRRTHF
ncbi:MAG: RNA polymerase factor sigma-54, partial [Deltaproteobacteria bacterium]|nr:RNA polymerase factor sigma-54 [Deltaproteobacteria bacterium]